MYADEPNEMADKFCVYAMQGSPELQELGRKLDIHKVTAPTLQHLVAQYHENKKRYSDADCVCVVHGETKETYGDNAHTSDDCYIMIKHQEAFRAMRRQAVRDARAPGAARPREAGVRFQQDARQGGKGR